MAFSSEIVDRPFLPGESLQAGKGSAQGPLLSPPRAWLILRKRTGGHVSRSTFYRWLESGRVYSLRMGTRMYVPWQALQEVIRRCLSGEPF